MVNTAAVGHALAAQPKLCLIKEGYYREGGGLHGGLTWGEGGGLQGGVL